MKFFLNIIPFTPLSLARALGSWGQKMGLLPIFYSLPSHGSAWEKVTKEAKPPQVQIPSNSGSGQPS